MNKSLITGVIAGAVIATGAGAAAYALKHKGPAYADVVHVEPIQKTIRTPRQECRDDTVAGNTSVQKRAQDAPRTVPKTEKRCVTVYDTHIERSGYDVRYRIGEREGTVRMDHDPGDRIPLRQGKLVLDAHTGAG